MKELFVDSTFKTNSQKLEMFVILGTLLRTGFPIAYFFLAGANELEDSQRKKSIHSFFQALQQSLPSLKPLSFFSDKDKGQIEAIENFFTINVSLCLWHMKRSIKKICLASERINAMAYRSTRKRPFEDC